MTDERMESVHRNPPVTSLRSACAVLLVGDVPASLSVGAAETITVPWWDGRTLRYQYVWPGLGADSLREIGASRSTGCCHALGWGQARTR